ncbi:hypothetical protein [Paraburkholderia terrae]
MSSVRRQHTSLDYGRVAAVTLDLAASVASLAPTRAGPGMR